MWENADSSETNVFVDFIPKPVDRHSRLNYEANHFNGNFNNCFDSFNNFNKYFNKFLTILKCSVDLDFDYVTVDSCMNSNFYVIDFYSLAQFTRLNFVKVLTPESTSISISLDPLFLWLLSLSLFPYAFLKNGHEKTLKYILIVFVVIQSYLSSPSLGRMCTKVKACHQIQFFTPEYIHACDALDNFRFNYQFKIFTISNINRWNNKFFPLRWH